MKKLILSAKQYIQKLALIEENKLSEFLVFGEKYEELAENFYKGRIKDIVPSINTIFIDIGLEKNAFLNITKSYKNIRFSVDDEIIVQVKKEERDEKGAELSLDYSLASKNLVLLVNSKKISFSNKIKDEKKIEKLKKIFENSEMGLIVRTSAVFETEGNLKKEYENLKLKWENIKKIASQSKSGKLIYSQNSLLEKLFREYFDESIDELVVDDESIYKEIRKYIDKNNLENLKSKIKRYFKEEDIFDFYSINVDIENALREKLWLRSGAYLVIEKTEAFVSIDVNTGQNTQNKDLEKSILYTNIEAAEEIPRQLRLRNLAGIVIIDFIDMKKSQNRNKVLEVLKENLKKDRLQTEVVNFSSLNLVQLTRKRHGKELASYFKEACPYCGGSGRVKSKEAIILEILKDIEKITEDRDILKIEIVANKKIIENIEKDFKKYIKNILNPRKKEIIYMIDENIKEYEMNLYK